jgi:hypothetical protein
MLARISLFLMAILVFIGCQTAEKSEVDSYGEKLTLTDTTAISRILANPDDFVGKKVLVNGEILDVCPSRGCWMDIAGNKPGEKIRIKVEDGVIVFPVEAKGNEALAEGEVEKLELTETQARGWFQHVADEKGEPFDSTSVNGPMTIYRIKGSGAEIKG